MLWVARENWVWLLVAALLGAAVSTVLTLRRTPEPTLVGAVAAPAPIKATQATMLFHTEASPDYERLAADEWFTTEDEAREAGYARWELQTPPTTSPP